MNNNLRSKSPGRLVRWVTAMMLFTLCGFNSMAQVSHLVNPTYGYTFTSAAGTYTALSGGTVFQSGATLNTDANSAAIPIPITFTYNNIRVYNLYINNNGYVTFTLPIGTASLTVPLSTTTSGVGGYDGAIAGLANNLVAAATGTPEIRYGTNGGGDFVIQYQDLAVSGSTSTRITFQILLKADGKTVQIIYGPNNTGQAGVGGSQVGLRGTNDEDYNNRALSSGGNWNTSGGAAGTASTNTMTWTASSTLPASGLTFTWTANAYTPTYLATPFATCQEFTTWVNGSGPSNVPSTNWASNGYGNASWQIDNTTATTTTSGWTSTGGAYSPVDYVSAVGGRSARFQSFIANSPQVGYLDYYVDFSSATGIVTLDFYQINPSGTDILQVFLSTDGGNSFSQVGTNYGVATSWTQRTISLGAITSATSIIRFKGTADFGSDGIGLDHVCLSLPVACPVPTAVAASSITPTTASISWTCTGCTGTYSIDYGPTGHAAGTGTIINGITSPYTLNPPLTSNTGYTVYIRQDCTGGGNGLSGWSGAANFTTARVCPGDLGAGTVTVGSLPYSISGQTTCGNGNNVTGTNVAAVCGSSSYYGGEDKTYIFTPASSGVYTILLTTATDDDAGITLYQGCPYTAGSTCVANAQSTSGLTRTLTPTLTSGITYYLVVDNFPSPACIGTYSLSITPPAACPVPTALAAGSVTATTASITWTCTGCTGTFDLDYGANGHAAGTGTIITGVTSPYTLNPPLASSTAYTVYVRQDCSNTANGIGAWTAGVNFTTLAPPPVCPGGLGVNSVTVGSLPYSTTAQTTCGSGNNVTSANVVSVCGSTNYYGAEDRTYIFTPTTTGVHTILLTTGTDDDAGLMLYQGCPFTGGSTCVANAQSTTGLTRTLTPTLTSGITYYLVVDNWTAPACIGTYSLNIDPPVACPVPTAVAAGSITQTTASISWTCTGCTGTFELDYGANGHAAGTGTIITGVTSPYTLNPPLSSGTAYTVYVRQDCSNTANGFGAWSSAVNFTTLSPPPANDVCSGAIVIPGAGPFPYTTGATSNINATGAGDPAASCQVNTGRGIWYTYTPAVTGSYTISSCQSAAPLSTVSDNVLAIFSSTNGCTGPLTPVSCDDDGCSTLTLQGVVTTNLTLGTQYYILVYAYTFSGPTANPGDVSINIVAPACVPTAFNVTGGGSYCTGGTGVLVGLSGSDLGYDYQLFNGASPVGGAVAGTGSALNFGLQTAAGNYTVVSTNAVIGTCSATMGGTATVSINPLPTAAISGDANICLGGSTNLTINFTGTAPWLYAINGGTPVSTSNNPETVSVSPTGNTVYTVTSVSDANCTGTTSGSATVNVTTAPPVGSCTIATIPTSGCVGNVISVSTTVVPGATGYTWSVPSGTLINGLAGPQTTASNTVSITLGALPANSSAWEICAFASNPCGQTNTNCKYVRGSLSTPAAITGSTVACPSTSGVYSTNAVSGATGYLWTGNNGITFTGTGTSVTANFPAGYTTGTICVAGQLPCGYTGPTRCITVTNGTPLLGALSGTFTVCPGTNGVSYSVPPSAGANSYAWTLPAFATIASGAGTNSITVDFQSGFAGGNICVTATSICGINSAPRCKTIASNKPGTPTGISGAATGVCGQNITYTITAVAGATSYTWTAPGGATLNSPNGSNSIDVLYPGNYTNGNLCVTANNGCGSSTPRCVAVKGTPSNPGTISGPAVVCANESGDTYSVGAVYGATSYTWSTPSGTTIVSGQGTAAIILDWGSNGGVIGVTATGSCGNSGTRTLNVAMTCKISGSTMPGTEVSAYPNPVSNMLNVDVNSLTSGVYTLELMDLSGRVVYSSTMNTVEGMNSNQVDVSSYSKGMYMLSVKNSEGFAKQIRIAVE